MNEEQSKFNSKINRYEGTIKQASNIYLIVTKYISSYSMFKLS